jgi:hypothetical protein
MLNASSEIGRRGFALPASLMLGTLHAALQAPGGRPVRPGPDQPLRRRGRVR